MSHPTPAPVYIVTTDEMRQIESLSNARGHTYDAMMRLAGAGVARAVAEQIDSGVVVVLCGPGNNGGDALVAAGLLERMGYGVRVGLWRRDASATLPEVPAQLGDAPMLALGPDGSLEQLEGWLADAAAVIDGLLGTGMKRPIEGDLADVLDRLAAATDDDCGPIVVAIDVPTGLDSDTGALDPHTAAADVTVTLGYPKHGQLRFPGAGAVGELVVEDIGLAPDLFTGDTELVTEAAVAAMLPPRPLDAHKGTFGRLLIVAGSIPYTGAACLAAEAAYRVGCGLVRAAVPASVRPVMAAVVPEATYLLLPEDLGVIARDAAALVADASATCEALVIGPGLTTLPPAAQFVGALFGAVGSGKEGIGFNRARAGDAGPSEAPSWKPTLVVDADGLNLLGPSGLGRLPAGSVLTPHPGEMARLTGRATADIQTDRVAAARQAATEWGHIVVLKGAFTVVASPDGRVAVLPFANAALAKAGTGDVLAGALGGLLAQGVAAREAAIAAGYIHGLAGELAAEAVGARSVKASDVAARLGRALAQIEAAT